MRSESRRRGVRKWVLRGLIAVTAVVLLVAAAFLFAVGTRAGGRMAVEFALSRIPLAAEVDGFDGRLLDRFELSGVSVSGPSFEVRVSRVRVDWRSAALLRRRVELRSLDIDGVDVALLEGPPPQGSQPAPPPDSARAAAIPDLPVEIRVASGIMREIRVRRRDSTWLSGGIVEFSGKPADYRLSFSGSVSPPDGPNASITAEAVGSAEALRLDRFAAQVLEGSLAGVGEIRWWPSVSWDLSIVADTLQAAPVMSDPAAWPGVVSLRAETRGHVSEGGQPVLDAAVDTVFGVLRGEPLSGRFEGHVRGPVLDLTDAALRWGAADFQATGRVADTLHLAFEAVLPDIGLAIPGATGRFQASGRATGLRTSPRIRARVQATDVTMDSLAAERVEGDVDFDLGGPVSADLQAFSIHAGGQSLDSLAVRVSGRREAHALEARARGQGAEIDLRVEGGLQGSSAWSGVIQAFRLKAVAVGEWTLQAPARGALSAKMQSLERACFNSPPATVCIGGERAGRTWQVDVAADSVSSDRFDSHMPEGLRVETIMTASARVRFAEEGGLQGQLDARTGEGAATVPTRSGPRRLTFRPLTLTAEADEEGIAADMAVHVADSAGRDMLLLSGSIQSPERITGPEDLRRLWRSPADGHLDLAIEDLGLLAERTEADWRIAGRLQAVADLQTDEEGKFSGRVGVATEGFEFRRSIRGEERVLTVEPFRFRAAVGPEGLEGEFDVEVASRRLGSILVARGDLAVPGLNRPDVDFESMPVTGAFDLTVSDLSGLEAVLMEVSDVSGNFEMHSVVAGTPADLTVQGEARLRDGSALVSALGVRLTDIQFRAAGTPGGTIEIDGGMTSGSGRVTLRGRSEATPSADSPTRIEIRGDRFVVLDIPEARVEAQPAIDLTFDGSTMWLRGEVALPTGRLGLPEIPPTAITPSEDVVIVGDTIASPEPRVPFGSDLRLTIGPDVLFNGLGFAANMEGEIRIMQEPGGEPRGQGEVRFLNGTYRNLGQELRIDPGRLVFSGPLDDPAVDARAYVTATDGTEAGFRIGGTAQSLNVTTYSRPTKTDSEVMSYILFGHPMSQTSGSEGSEASNAAAVLGANMLAMSLAPSVGLDEARIETGSNQNKAQFVVGKYLSPKLYVGYGVGIYEPISTLRIRYLLTSKWSIEAITGDQQSTDLLYRIERGGPKSEVVPAETDPATGSGTSEAVGR